MKLVHTAAQARRFVAFNDLAGDFLKMLGVAVLSGLFFSLVVGLVVFLVASEAYAQPAGALAAPQKLALRTGAPPGFVRQVIFMTDGAVGTGAAPNSFFMTKAAQPGLGTFTYIGDVREVHEKMAGLFRKLESPVLKDVDVHWPRGGNAETWPEHIPDFYSGEPITFLAQVDSNVAPLHLSGLPGNQPWSMALTPPEQRAENGVGALWARHKIANLVDQARIAADPGKVRASAVDVALEHRRISKYIRMVAVDVTPARAGHAELISSPLPTNTPANWWQQGELPQTATSATQNLIAGSFTMLLGAAVLLDKGRCDGGML